MSIIMTFLMFSFVVRLLTSLTGPICVVAQLVIPPGPYRRLLFVSLLKYTLNLIPCLAPTACPTAAPTTTLTAAPTKKTPRLLHSPSHLLMLPGGRDAQPRNSSMAKNGAPLPPLHASSD